MGLDPQCKAFLDMLAAGGGQPLETLPLDEARRVPRAMIELGGPVEDVTRVEDRTIAGPAGDVPVRVYHPAPDERRPAVLFFHGGGFVICNLDTHDRQCRALTNASGCVVIAVDYRLAPEHPFPAAPEDCYAATRAVAEHPEQFGADGSRIAVAGDSAGGNLAAAVTLMARDRRGPALRFQLLIYPSTDLTDTGSGSMQEYGRDHFLTVDTLRWFTSQYLPAADTARHPYASPLLSADLAGVPPALVITAECDPLRDQAEAYARKLQGAGVPVVMKRYDGAIHPFFSLPGIVDAGRQALGLSAAALREALSPASPP